MRERVATLARWTAAAGLLAALGFETAGRGPIRLHPPQTSVSLTQPAIEGLLVFLKEASARVPDGATVAVVAGEGRAAFLFPVMVYFLAEGQLADETVVRADTLPLSGELPDYLAVYGSAGEDPRFLFLEELPGGALYKRAPP